MTTPQPCPCPCQQQHDDDLRWFAMLIRRGMLLIAKGIEQKYGIDERRDRA